ncbi:hypothetical protein ACGFK1_29990 [Mycobacterium sp. NPDC048908]|uniref:hypothetical protein n=1 Tax=Mycobacterium sp. NPDC048908 TaxID=3364292 RepID=UPI003714D1D7
MKITSTLTRYLVLPAISAGALGGAALGVAGLANAGTYPTHDPKPRPGIVATPGTVARPPVVIVPGHRWHRDRTFVIDIPVGE